MPEAGEVPGKVAAGHLCVPSTGTWGRGVHEGEGFHKSKYS